MTLLEWKEPQLSRLLDKGGLVASDFGQGTEGDQQALARELFLLCCQD